MPCSRARLAFARPSLLHIHCCRSDPQNIVLFDAAESSPELKLARCDSASMIDAATACARPSCSSPVVCCAVCWSLADRCAREIGVRLGTVGSSSGPVLPWPRRRKATPTTRTRRVAVFKLEHTQARTHKHTTAVSTPRAQRAAQGKRRSGSRSALARSALRQRHASGRAGKETRAASDAG